MADDNKTTSKTDYHKLYYQNNKDKIKEQQQFYHKLHYQTNKDIIKGNNN